MLGGLLALLLPFGKAALERALDTVDKTVSEETRREELKADIIKQHLQNRTDVLLRGAYYMTVAFAVPLLLFWTKVIVWDKILGLGSTDPLMGQAADWADVIINFLFLVPLGGAAIARFKK